MIHNSLKQILTDYYALDVTTVVVAPRQFVAETFFVKTEDVTYLCKVINKPLFIDNVISSLPALADIHNLGYSKINYPIPTSNGDLFVREGTTLVVLFNYIDAPQSYDYDNAVLGKTIAEIHQLSPQMTAPIKHEQFVFEHAEMFMDKLDQISDEVGRDEIANDLHQLMKTNYSKIVNAYKKFQIVAKDCSSAVLDFVVTHGDAPGNVLVKAPDDIYIVDWDDILLAPAERDLWFLLEDQDFIEGYKTTIPHYIPTQVLLDYYLLSRYFNDMVEFWEEILGNFSAPHRAKNLEQLNHDLLSKDGWLFPQIQNLLKLHGSY